MPDWWKEAVPVQTYTSVFADQPTVHCGGVASMHQGINAWVCYQQGYPVWFLPTYPVYGNGMEWVGLRTGCCNVACKKYLLIFHMSRIKLQWALMQYTELHCFAMEGTALKCIAMYCTVLYLSLHFCTYCHWAPGSSLWENPWRQEKGYLEFKGFFGRRFFTRGRWNRKRTLNHVKSKTNTRGAARKHKKKQ